MGDPYLASLTSKDSKGNVVSLPVHPRHISELGPTPVLPCITLTLIGGATDSWNVGLSGTILQVDIWGQKGYEEVALIYENRSPQTISSYGSIKGVKSKLHGQHYTLPSGITVALRQTFMQNRKETTGSYYNIVSRFYLWSRDDQAANVQSTY